MEKYVVSKCVQATCEYTIGLISLWGMLLPCVSAFAATTLLNLQLSVVFDTPYKDILYMKPNSPYFWIAGIDELTMRNQFDGEYRFEVGDSKYISCTPDCIPLGFIPPSLGIRTETTIQYFTDKSQFLASGKKGCPTLIAGVSGIITTTNSTLPCDRIDGLSETKYVLPAGAKAVLRRDAFNYQKGDNWEECLFVISLGAIVILPDGRSDNIYPGEHYCENSAGNRWVKVYEIFPESGDGTGPTTPDIYKKLGLGYPLNFAETLQTFDAESGRKRIESVFDALEQEYGAGERDSQSLETGARVGIFYTTPSKGQFYWVFEGPLYRKLSFDPVCQSGHSIEISDLGEYRFCFGNHYGMLLPNKLGYEAERTNLVSYLTDLDKDATVDELDYGEKKGAYVEKGIYVQFRGASYRFFMSPRNSLATHADVSRDSPLGISRVKGTGVFSVVYATEWKIPGGGISEVRYRYFLVPYAPLSQIRQILHDQGYSDFNIYWRDDGLVTFKYQGFVYSTIPLLPGEECSLTGKEGFYPDSRGLVFEVEGFGCQRFILSESGL